MTDEREDIRRELIEDFIEDLHFERMEAKLSVLSRQLLEERAKPDADPAHISELKNELMRVQREDYLNFDLTRQELLGSR